MLTNLIRPSARDSAGSLNSAQDVSRGSGGQDVTRESSGHDHATGIVPASERRGAFTFGLLWVTMVTGFPTVLAGFEWFKAGLTLTQVLQGATLSCLFLLAYGIPATLLGAKSGQTYSLLSRQIFGRWGSRIVSFNLVWISTCWYGLNASWLAQGLNGMYHFDISTFWLACGFAVAMAFNNYFGFKGIANFARYIAAPMLIAWVGFTFFKAALTCPHSVWSMPAHQSFPQALTIVSTFVIGYGVWGNEADYWRYSRPKAMLSAIPLFAALLIGQFIFPVTGWMMAQRSGITEAGAATNLMNQYAFGGASIIAAAVLLVAYFAVNDSGLYGAINGVENLKAMPRKFVVTGLTIAGVVATALLVGNDHAFEYVATISSIFLPGATVIMIAEFFWLAKLNPGSIDFSRIPSFDELPAVKWRAVAALAAGGMVGILTSGLIPGLASWHVGICSLQSWVACVCVYACLRFLERPIVLDDQQRAMFERLLPVEEAVT